MRRGGILGAIISRREPQLLQDVDWARDPFFRETLSEYTSVMAIPVTGNRLPMTWAIGLKKPPKQFTVSDLEETVERAALVGALLENQILAGRAGFLLCLITLVGLRLTGGWQLPAGGPLVLGVAVAGGFFLLPDLEARQEAGARRRDFRRALGAYLDLVALEMAGSAAPAEALPNAARVGAGWPLALIRDTLFGAALSGRNNWDALTDLGERIGVDELRDLGRLVRQVERDGAQVRQTLTARAATMRQRELAEAEGLAGERDQSMRLAQLLVGFGFVVFLGYPAIVNVMAL